MDIEQILKRNGKKTGQQGDKIFALDIGTRTVVGIVGEKDGDIFRVAECVSIPHTRRAMVDGQVEDIKQVAKIVGEVKAQLEAKCGFTLQRACIAAAGRALKTVNISKEFDISDSEIITEEMVASMEMETISLAQTQLDEETKKGGTLFYCVGHNVVSYFLDNYKMISLIGHKGQKVQINMVVAFLPGIVVEGLYSVMELNKLEVQSLTLEPIAAMNVIIPPEIRLINIALVDIGAGTSDIAISKDGSIIAYAMATVAGDEITEEIIKTFLVDFAAAEQMKYDADSGEEITYKDIFGLSHTITQAEFIESILPSMDSLSATICDAVLKINGGPPQAVFLVGGGSLIKGLTTLVADKLDIEEDRVAVGGSEFVRNVDVGRFKMGAEYITPIGIGVTALSDRGYDFSVITVNDKKVRVFDTKKLTVFQLLSAAGFKAAEIMGHSGQGLTFTLNGNKIFRKGTLMTSAEIIVNGKNAGLTTVVTQGDKVTVIPAKNGENAHTTLAKEIDYSKYNSGSVSFGGKKYKFGLEVTVNGAAKDPDYEIQPLDQVVTSGILTLGDLLESIGIEYSEGFAVNGRLAEQAYVLTDGDVITIKMITSILGENPSAAIDSRSSLEALNKQIQAANTVHGPKDDESSGAIRTIQTLIDANAAKQDGSANPQAVNKPMQPAYVPTQTVNLSVQSADVPVQAVSKPAQTVAVPNQNANVSAQTVGVPNQNTNVSAQTVGVPNQNANIPAQAIGIPNQNANISAQAASVPNVNAQQQSEINSANTANFSAQSQPAATETAYNSTYAPQSSMGDLQGVSESSQDLSQELSIGQSAVSNKTDEYPQINMPSGKNLSTELYGVQTGRIPAIQLTLNGSPITLPEKNDGEPHTFLELMSYADLDTKNPQGSGVELTLNGSEISFGAELHQGDKAIVRWKN